MSHRNALRAMTRAKNAPRNQGKFTQPAQFDWDTAQVQLSHVHALRTKLHTLLTQTNGNAEWAKAIINTLATALRHSLPPLDVQVEIFQIVLTHIESLAQQHPEHSFPLETVLEPVLSHPAVTAGYEKQKSNPESHYWAAQSLGASNDYAYRFGQPALSTFLDAHDYLNQTWQAMWELTTAALEEV